MERGNNLTLGFINREKDEAELVEGLRYGRLASIATCQVHMSWCQDWREMARVLGWWQSEVLQIAMVAL